MNIQTRILIARLLVSVLAERLADLARRKFARGRKTSSQVEVERFFAAQPKATSVRDRSAEIHREAEILQASSEGERQVAQSRPGSGPERGDAK